jgi:DNA-binding phage protein
MFEWSITMISPARAPYYDYHLSPKEQVNLFEIAYQMKQKKLPDEFISMAIQLALKFEGINNLVNLWANETEQSERNEIVADLQGLIDDCSQQDKQEYVYIKFNDLDSIAKDIRAFKDSLLEIVMAAGGLTHLSELTQIPQPSLSRFFNSHAMPQRNTLLKIAKALNIDAVKVNHQWVR